MPSRGAAYLAVFGALIIDLVLGSEVAIINEGVYAVSYFHVLSLEEIQGLQGQS